MIDNEVKVIFKVIFGDWGLGIGDWGLGIGDPIPNPQSPIPNPQLNKQIIYCVYEYCVNK